MSAEIVCWKCGAPLIDLILPMSRREECAACGVDQHVCRLCRNYDPNVSDQCKEDRAEVVAEKERANFCDYFEPKSDAFETKNIAAEQAARNQLADLFGENAFDKESDSLSPEDKAQREWEKLFGGEKD